MELEQIEQFLASDDEVDFDMFVLVLDEILAAIRAVADGLRTPRKERYLRNCLAGFVVETSRLRDSSEYEHEHERVIDLLEADEIEVLRTATNEIALVAAQKGILRKGYMDEVSDFLRARKERIEASGDGK